MFKKILILICIIMLSYCTMTLAEEVLLRWRFDPANKISYDLTNQIQGISSWDIVAFLNEGVPLQEKITKYDVNLIFNSSGDETAQITINSISTNNQPMPPQSLPHIFTIDSKGLITNVKFYPVPVEIIPLHILFFLSEGTVSIGSDWIKVIPQGPLGPETKITSTLLGFEDIKGYNCAKIKTHISQDFTNVEFMPSGTQSGELKAEGISYFAVKEGRYIRIDLNIESNTRLDYQTLTGEQKTISTAQTSKIHVELKD